MKQVVVLAGGLATRLKPITKDTPKSLIPISGIPFIELQIQNLLKIGIRNIHFCLGNQAPMIEEYLANSKFTDLVISTSRDSKSQRGTAGALVDAFKFIQDEFFLTYGDSYLPIDLASLEESWSKLNSKLKLSVKDVKESRHRPNVQLEENGQFYYGNKTSNPTHIDYGFMKLNKDIIRYIKNEDIQNFETVIEKMSLAGSATCAVIEAPLYEIGSFEGIIELENYIGGHSELHP